MQRQQKRKDTIINHIQIQPRTENIPIQYSQSLKITQECLSEQIFEF